MIICCLGLMAGACFRSLAVRRWMGWNVGFCFFLVVTALMEHAAENSDFLSFIGGYGGLRVRTIRRLDSGFWECWPSCRGFWEPS